MKEILIFMNSLFDEKYLEPIYWFMTDTVRFFEYCRLSQILDISIVHFVDMYYKNEFLKYYNENYENKS